MFHLPLVYQMKFESYLITIDLSSCFLDLLPICLDDTYTILSLVDVPHSRTSVSASHILNVLFFAQTSPSIRSLLSSPTTLENSKGVNFPPIQCID